MKILNIVLGMVTALAPMVSFGENPKAFEDKCTRSVHSQIYSNAQYIEDAGDVIEVLEAFERVAIRLFIFGMAVYGLVRAAAR